MIPPTPTRNPQTLDGPCSSVWTATIARVGAFFSIFRALQDLHSFAPLQIQKFCKKSPNFFCANFCKISQILLFFKQISSFFDWILMKISRNFKRLQQNTVKCWYSRKKRYLWISYIPEKTNITVIFDISIPPAGTILFPVLLDAPSLFISPDFSPQLQFHIPTQAASHR